MTEEITTILPRVPKRRFRNWISERLWSLFPNTEIDQRLEQSPELLRRRKIVEFVLLPGRVHAKVTAEEDKQVRVDIAWPAYTESQWSEIVNILDTEAFFLSMLLTGDLPAELDTRLAADGLSLCPRPEEISITVGGAPMTEVTKEVAIAVSRFTERFDDDPFGLFFLRGKTRDEVIMELWEARRRGRATSRKKASAADQLPPVQQSLEGSRVHRFWTADETIFTIPYSLRADELPASLLKRLDTLPISDGEENLDRLFEDAYAQVATRAQAYAIGL